MKVETIDEDVIEFYAEEDEFEKLLEYVKKFEKDWDYDVVDDSVYYDGEKFSLIGSLPDNPFDKIEFSAIGWNTKSGKTVWVYL